MPMFNIDSDTLVRIERSPYIGGHFYMRFKKNTQTMTLGFGYDEHHQETNPILKSPLITSIQLLHTIIHPVSEKWVIYKNDHPRNNKLLPNTYHVVVDWFCLLEETIQIINDIINGKLNEKLVDVFRLPFCAFPVNGESHNCRSLLVHIIKDSLSRDGYLKLNQYMIGNAHIHDIQNGCMTFRVKIRK